MLSKITVVVKEMAKWWGICVKFFGVLFFFSPLFFLADLHVLSDMILNILKSYATKMVLGDPSKFSMSLA